MRVQHARPGFGPQPIFFEIILPHFHRSKRRLATAFLGSACEQWINGECFIAVCKARQTFWVRPERHKHDLVLYASGEDDPSGGRGPALIIETKVVYSSESLQSQDIKLKKLREQLRQAAKRFPQAKVVGFLVSFEWSYKVRGEYLTPGCSRRGPFRTANERRQRGLVNAFGHINGGARIVVKDAKLQMGENRYKVTAKLEMLGVPRS